MGVVEQVIDHEYAQELELKRLREENESLRGEARRLAALVEGYRRIHPRLIAQAANARLEAAGLQPKEIRCPSMHPAGWVCDLMAGHTSYHHHESGQGSARRVWGDT